MLCVGAGAQQGSVAIIRLSGPEAVQIAASVFKPSQGRTSWAPKTHRIYHGYVLDGDGSIIDEVSPCCTADAIAQSMQIFKMASSSSAGSAIATS